MWSQCLQEGDHSISDCMEEFQYLLAHNDVMEDEDQLVGQYLGGLWSSLWKVMSVHPCWIVTEAYQRTAETKESQNIKIPQSKASISQSMIDKGGSKSYGQRSKEDKLVVHQLNQIRWVNRIWVQMVVTKARPPCIVLSTMRLATYHREQKNIHF